MDYEFFTDEQGIPVAQFSMDHEAIGSWFTNEIGTDKKRLQELFALIEKHEQQHFKKSHMSGKDLQLEIDQEIVEITAINDFYDRDQNQDEEESSPDSTDLFDAINRADCGLMDFKDALLSWQEFISE